MKTGIQTDICTPIFTALVHLNVTRLQSRQEEIFVAGASLITLVHLVTWGWCLHPVCGDVVAAGKCEVLKLTIQ